MSSEKEMEAIRNDQNQLMANMNRLFENYKKDGPSRRTESNINNKLTGLDGFWQEFQSNHARLVAFQNEDCTYYAEKTYNKTKTFYESARSVLLDHLETAKSAPLTTRPRPISQKPAEHPSSAMPNWAEEKTKSEEVHPGPSNHQSRAVPQDQQSENQEKTATRAPVNTGFAIPPIFNFTEQPSLDAAKLSEKMRKQQSNFKAFAHTLHYIDLSTINEKWELEDLLKSVQSRWATIDTLHWDIDSELLEDDETYNQTFYKYEKKFQDIKKSINSKIWSMAHREKSTPVMDIPPFSGNYQQWVSFKDLFNEAIHHNRSMSNAQKMQFLKNKVRGEAEKLIQHLNISSENYETCWEILNHRYNNTKLIFTAHLNNLLSLSTMQQQSYQQIKRLHDTTNECLNAIRNLGVDTSSWDPLIVHILSQKLDAESHTEYVESLKNPRDLPTLKEFLDFLEMKFTSFEASRRMLDTPKPSQQSETSRKPYYKSFVGIKDSSLSQNKSNDVKSSYYQRKHCPVCNKNHGIFNCETFQSAKPERKRSIIASLNLCKNCLYNHYDKECFSTSRCRTCQERHNTLVHDAYSQKQDTSDLLNKRKTVATITQECNKHIEVLLPTALIKARAVDGTYHILRAFIDPGAQMSLITEAAAQLLQIPRESCDDTMYGLGITGNTCNGVINVTMSSMHCDFQFNGELFIMNKLTLPLPNQTFIKPDLSYLRGLPLADPDYNISCPIDIILGTEIYAKFVQNGTIIKGDDLPVAQKTKLGYIINGKVPLPSYQCCTVVNNMTDISRFWTIEDINEASSLSSEDQHCINFYRETTFRQEDGRYVVRLPLKPEMENALGHSKNIAIAQFRQLEIKFRKDQNIEREYKKFIREYISLGHMRECTDEIDGPPNSTQECFLPHHCVQRPESATTSLRVVYNASSKTSNGTSLNDIMYNGPNLQHDLLSLIIKWRQYKVAYVADIEKMFRMIGINIQDQKYQKIIWRDNEHQRFREYALTTTTYGTKAAPWLAMMTLRQLAKDERHNYPEAAKVVEESFYMDDLLHGCHDLESAKKMKQHLIELLESGGFNLRKWASNTPELLQGVSKSQDQQQAFEFKDQETTKTLGLRWHPQEDLFTFQLKITPLSTLTSITMTKRELLSSIAKVFDPLGWLSPVTTKLKLLFQNVISNDIGWNDQVPHNIKKEWYTISQDLQTIKDIKIPRWLNTYKNQDLELHGYCDASTKAYACAIYCRVIPTDEKQSTPPPVLIAAKSRLVPTKKAVTLPRLELCSALLLSALMEKVKQSLSENKIKLVCWSDSTAVLGWLNGEPSKWKPFIANRVTQITKIIPPTCWNYVKSEENPADCASRGITAQQLLKHPLWWNGPKWLSSYSENQERPIFTTDQEVKTSKQSHAVTCKQTDGDIINELISKHSNLTHCTRVLAWILRVASRRQQNSSYLTADELRSAKNRIIKYVQEREFANEIVNLKTNQSVDLKSNILKLRPFLDQHGMLRVRGRLHNAHISWEMKHPLIIPHRGRLTELLIDQAHKAVLHGTAKLTHSKLRESVWIVGGNRATKNLLRRCITCLKQKPPKLSQLMGDLPESRSNPSRPFYNTGVDYTGYVSVKASKGRGIKTTKGYIAVFVCMATKAVHLELVSDLSSESFLAALRRMSARRGAPRHIFSDNGTNFTKANKAIKREYEEITASLDESFFKAISDMNISWHFNAPSWPSAGGLWEAAVKSLKHHLHRVLGEQHLTFEEFSTLLAQIEGCLNARPLCALTEDPDDLDYITPAHFLASGPTLHIVETERDERTRWRLTQKIFQDVWKKWQTEYLCQLQSRCKWTQPKPNIEIGDVVIIHDANLPAGKWALGRVSEVHAGKDGLVRVASVKTKNSIIKRPIIKLSKLPVSENESSTSEEQKKDSSATPPAKQTNQRKPAKSKLIGYITMALMMFMLFISPAQCAHDVSRFKEGQGIYFDKITNMKLARDEWKLVVYYDINPYWEGSELFSKYIKHLENMCHAIKNKQQCNIVLTQLRHAFSELKYYDSMLLGQRVESPRKKRAFFNGVGNIAHSLFGVLDDQFAEQYQKDIDLTRANEKHLAQLWRNQTSVIEAEANLLKRVETSMQNQHKTFNQHINNIEMSLNKQATEIQESVDFKLMKSPCHQSSLITYS
ncbi:uncharacterized protein LOC134659099 [Cydia amplana]|uniref:uncharacterized protein LOC134659099 n=1 Tax=Cydia amplana TaxID=1869771 RepID=UPI002FE5A6D2